MIGVFMLGLILGAALVMIATILINDRRDD